MRPLRTRLQEAHQRLGIPWEILERDYLLSWVLAGIGQVPVLRDTLVCKGGTALKKCYFGDYRFSEDLDFSGLGDRAYCEIHSSCAGRFFSALRKSDTNQRTRSAFTSSSARFSQPLLSTQSRIDA